MALLCIQMFSCDLMKKMKILFVKEYDLNENYLEVKNEVTEGCDWY